MMTPDFSSNNSLFPFTTELLTSATPMDTVDPSTLPYDWNRVARLLITTGLSVLGSVGNGYMISSVMIEDHLRRRGNTYIAVEALADLLVSGVVIPVSAVMILAGIKQAEPIKEIMCHVQWFLTLLCSLVTVWTLAMIAMENYVRLCMPPECYTFFSKSHIILSVIMIWLVSILLTTLQFIYKVGPDYCSKKVSYMELYQGIIGSLFFFIPIIITCILYMKITYKVRLARQNPSFKPPVIFGWDYSLMLTNMYSYIMFIVLWIPFCIVMSVASFRHQITPSFYYLAWLALSKSCINSVLYCISNRHFRNAYINLFHYCCCKTTVTFSRRSRGDATRPSGDVRVHIIPGYNMYSYTSPQRGRDASKRVLINCNNRPCHNRSYEL
ncbi:melatonin receptor type 1B-like [Diaphorina citri]|uniref:Melatonin receptor type 1B-like n=1 Tax=Diaphorina citri TaxID=121845 RepID=A0A1S4EFB0_DIACI|nr:melatonin receptor type 1B-like [Diaphorina citri]XP_026681816.1 melatonin receptor type 1B-like [Diaphorina citri]